MRPLFSNSVIDDGTQKEVMGYHGDRQVEVDVHTWRQPVTGSDIVTGFVIPCPHCTFPMQVVADPSRVNLEDGLSYLGILQCPGRWPVHAQDPGRGQKQCNWRGYALKGRLHDQGCTALVQDGTGQLRAGVCRCGSERQQ